MFCYMYLKYIASDFTSTLEADQEINCSSSSTSYTAILTRTYKRDDRKCSSVEGSTLCVIISCVAGRVTWECFSLRSVVRLWFVVLSVVKQSVHRECAGRSSHYIGG